MKIKPYLALALSIISMVNLEAKEIQGLPIGKPNPSANTMNKSGDCQATRSRIDLEINNVRAKLFVGGDMWWTQDAAGTAAYQVPKGTAENPGKSSLFAGSLWIGGLDQAGQLHMAAQTYRQTGNDYFAGPLSVNPSDGTLGTTDLETCNFYDNFYKVSRQEVQSFLDGGTLTDGITKWPGNGRTGTNEPQFLAPFYDADGDNRYKPENGDYPAFVFGDVARTACGECEIVNNKNLYREGQLFGDEAIWWVFNDKGNIHSETQGDAIGLEIHAQAFAYSSTDELNNMTFYKYDLYNRSTNKLNDVYVGIWTDADLGFYNDDYIGCDVGRGLGFVYNGDSEDEGPTGYGFNPPACGVDFFEGPFMDQTVTDRANSPCVFPEAVNGTGFGDGCSGNERMGMSRFVYYINDNTSPYGNPSGAQDFYNYLQGKNRNGVALGYGSATGWTGGTAARYAYPGSSDPLGVGTGCIPQAPWLETNAPSDRRFIQSAGTFTLLPGAKNSVTSGVVWARTVSGGPLASIELVKSADSKAQTLFNNCFQVVEGPDAPQLEIVELDKEVIINILDIDSLKRWVKNYKVELNGVQLSALYNFEGLMLYQLKDNSVSTADLDNPDKAKLLAQCDLKNNIKQIVNYLPDPLVNEIPVLKVDGKDEGLKVSFSVKKDLFAAGSNALVNHKKYNFAIIAYAYSPAVGLKEPFIQSRKTLTKNTIITYTAIPHIPQPESGGTYLNAGYGTGPKITRLEGQGNGGNALDFTPETEAKILADNYAEQLTYKNGRGPVEVKVVNPLKVPKGTFTIKLNTNNGPVQSGNQKYGALRETASWTITSDAGEVISSKETMKVDALEQLIPQWGLSVKVKQTPFLGGLAGEAGDINAPYFQEGYIESSIEFEDKGNQWLAFFPDGDLSSGQIAPLAAFDWIRAGINLDKDASGRYSTTDINVVAGSSQNPSPNEWYEKILRGAFAPYAVTSVDVYGPSLETSQLNIDRTASVDIVFTADKSKWTRCPVLEMSETGEFPFTEGGIERLDIRRGFSKNKDGGRDNSDGKQMGMSWFPGYAINLETGERLNLAFGEASCLSQNGGNDMLFNPGNQFTDKLSVGQSDATGSTLSSSTQIIQGGRHWLYVFDSRIDAGVGGAMVPRYDAGETIWKAMTEFAPKSYDASVGFPYTNTNRNVTKHKAAKKAVFKSAMWTALPLWAGAPTKFLQGDVRVKLRMAKAYRKGINPSTQSIGVTQNNDNPVYTFNTEDIFANNTQVNALKDVLDIINVVPNPYYAFSAYETGQADNRVKITNLPQKCTISIYTPSGALVRKFNRDVPTPTTGYKQQALTSLDWDLKNSVGVPISSGIYLIRVSVPEVGEKTLKFMCVMRPTDLDGF